MGWGKRMTHGAEDAQILQSVIGIVAVDMIELERCGLPAPLGYRAFFAAAILETFFDQPLAQLTAVDRVAVLGEVFDQGATGESLTLGRSLPEEVARIKFLTADAVPNHRICAARFYPLSCVDDLGDRRAPSSAANSSS